MRIAQPQEPRGESHTRERMRLRCEFKWQQACAALSIALRGCFRSELCASTRASSHRASRLGHAAILHPHMRRATSPPPGLLTHLAIYLRPVTMAAGAHEIIPLGTLPVHTPPDRVKGALR